VAFLTGGTLSVCCHRTRKQHDFIFLWKQIGASLHLTALVDSVSYFCVLCYLDNCDVSCGPFCWLLMQIFCLELMQSLKIFVKFTWI